MSRFRDFDLAAAERKAEPLVFKWAGREYELPPALPAAIPLEALRLRMEYGTEADIPEHEMFKLATKLLGQEVLEQIVADGVDVDTLGEIVTWAICEYQGVAGPEETEDLGNSQAQAPLPETAGS